MPSTRQPDYGECPVCGTCMMPVLEFLPCGHAEPPVIRTLDSEGVVYSWTRLWTSTESNRLLAMVDFLDGALRATAPVIGTDAIQIDDRVVACVGIDTPLAFTPPTSIPSVD